MASVTNDTGERKKSKATTESSKRERRRDKKKTEDVCYRVGFCCFFLWIIGLQRHIDTVRVRSLTYRSIWRWAVRWMVQLSINFDRCAIASNDKRGRRMNENEPIFVQVSRKSSAYLMNYIRAKRNRRKHRIFTLRTYPKESIQMFANNTLKKSPPQVTSRSL